MLSQLLTSPPPPLPVFIGPDSWLLFDACAPYLRITQPATSEKAEYGPIITPGFVWLKEDPQTWSDYDEYGRMKKRVDEIQTQNDASERAVKNGQEVAELTRDPNHRENIALVMNDHRSKNTGVRKIDLQPVQPAQN